MNNSNKKDMVPGSADLLIELGCEELPPKSLPKVGQALFDGFLAQLKKAEFEFDATNSRLYYTPRRLALLISGVAESQPDQVLEREPLHSADHGERDLVGAAARKANRRERFGSNVARYHLEVLDKIDDLFICVVR